MKVVFDDAQLAHYPKSFLSSGAPAENPEQPERAKILLKAALDSGLTRVVPPDFGLAPAAAVHTPEYLVFLQTIYERWRRIEGASAEVVPNIHPGRRDGTYPASAVGHAGWHMIDTSAPINAETWGSTLRSAHAAAHAADLVRSGKDAAYALCRPPGHHATRDQAAGFCYLANASIAARRLGGRVAVLDVDLHHGNGTQDIFYDSADVLTVSVHADPVRFYPFFWGHADERGDGRGLGYNLNLPLERGTGDAGFLDALATAIARIAAFAPDRLVVALGLDAHESDPFKGLAVTTEGFRRIGSAIGAMHLPTVLVQEGGYLNDALGANLAAFLSGFRGAR